MQVGEQKVKCKQDSPRGREPSTHQVDIAGGLQRVEEMHNKRAFTQGQGISLSLHLMSHVLIDHVCLFDNL